MRTHLDRNNKVVAMMARMAEIVRYGWWVDDGGEDDAGRCGQNEGRVGPTSTPRWYCLQLKTSARLKAEDASLRCDGLHSRSEIAVPRVNTRLNNMA